MVIVGLILAFLAFSVILMAGPMGGYGKKANTEGSSPVFGARKPAFNDDSNSEEVPERDRELLKAERLMESLQTMRQGLKSIQLPRVTNEKLQRLFQSKGIVTASPLAVPESKAEWHLEGVLEQTRTEKLRRQHSLAALRLPHVPPQLWLQPTPEPPSERESASPLLVQPLREQASVQSKPPTKLKPLPSDLTSTLQRILQKRQAADTERAHIPLGRHGQVNLRSIARSISTPKLPLKTHIKRRTKRGQVSPLQLTKRQLFWTHAVYGQKPAKPWYKCRMSGRHGPVKLAALQQSSTGSRTFKT